MLFVCGQKELLSFLQKTVTMAGKVLEVVFVVCMAALSSAAIYSNLNATLANK